MATLITAEAQFASDSPLEEGGFEPLVPLTLNATNAGERDEKIAMIRCAASASQSRTLKQLGSPRSHGNQGF
jgi:hypothetical protein